MLETFNFKILDLLCSRYVQNFYNFKKCFKNYFKQKRTQMFKHMMCWWEYLMFIFLFLSILIKFDYMYNNTKKVYLKKM